MLTSEQFFLSEFIIVEYVFLHKVKNMLTNDFHANPLGNTQSLPLFVNISP